MVTASLSLLLLLLVLVLRQFDLWHCWQGFDREVE
jgi:hypothetical protein